MVRDRIKRGGSDVNEVDENFQFAIDRIATLVTGLQWIVQQYLMSQSFCSIRRYRSLHRLEYQADYPDPQGSIELQPVPSENDHR